MSRINVNNADLHYQSVGNGSETILFSHGYLMNNTMFNGQIDEFKDRFRCISFDHRGHGQSEVTKNGYELDNLVIDAISLIEALDLGSVHFVGMSTGLKTNIVYNNSIQFELGGYIVLKPDRFR